MKKLIVFAALMVFLGVAVAYGTDLNRVPYPTYSGPNAPAGIQIFGPNGSLTQKLTVNNAAINLSNYIMFDIVIPASLTTCQIRLSSTAPATGYGTNTATVFPAATVITRSINAATKFANMSGCTNAYIEIQ